MEGCNRLDFNHPSSASAENRPMPRDAVAPNSSESGQGVIISPCSWSNRHAADGDLCLWCRNVCRAISLCLENRAVYQQTLVVLFYGNAQSLDSHPKGIS